MADLFQYRRITQDGMTSIGRLFDAAGEPLCYGLEPGPARTIHPCIPPDTYRLRLRTVGDKTAEYARYYGNKFGIGWHKGMVQLADVPDREAIEFHVGNSLADTLGCLLAGTGVLNPPGDGSGHYEVTGSRAAYERVYPVLRDAILAGGAQLQIIEAGGVS